MSSIEAELRRFEAELDEVTSKVKACVEQLRRPLSDGLRFLLAERLPVLGSAVLSGLQELLDDPASEPSVRYLAAWVAIEVGDRGDSISVLCAEVEANREWSLPAASALARHRIQEGVGSIAIAIARVDPTNTADVIGYATALRDLRGHLPTAIRRRILAESPSWVASAVEQDFPMDA